VARAKKAAPEPHANEEAPPVGYARVSTTRQNLTAQRNALAALGVEPDLVYVDHGLTGTNRARPGLREALAACRAGDTLVVTKLDRLARSLGDARDIIDELTGKGVKLNIGGSLHDPADPVGRLLFNVLGMVAEFESDLIRMRTREGLAVARAAGKLRGRKPKLSPARKHTSSSSTPAGPRPPPTSPSCWCRPLDGLPGTGTGRRAHGQRGFSSRRRTSPRGLADDPAPLLLRPLLRPRRAQSRAR